VASDPTPARSHGLIAAAALSRTTIKFVEVRMLPLLLYSHTSCLQHDPGPGHPEAPERLQVVLAALQRRFPAVPLIQSPAASEQQIGRVHDLRLLRGLQSITPTRGWARIDADTAVSPESLDAALHAAGAGCAAVDALIEQKARRAFCAVRPPGHHANRGQSMGFCLFNSIAVAAAHALERGLQRVAVVDFDVHHGNGTQDIFERDQRVGYFSSHQSPLYPGTGHADETGVGNIRNVPLNSGSGSVEFRHAWQDQLLPALRAFAPEMLFISAGFDAHYLDPLAGLAVTTDDYRWLTRALLEATASSSAGRVVSMLEGGYSPTALAEAVIAHVEALLDD
jgi:acetoin utilization deacetylase AcuC-like enzyme